MSLIKLQVKGISYSHSQNGAYALILDEVDGNRKLPIVIGAFEAQSIAIAIEEDIKPPRPLTHDLFKAFADRFQIRVKQVLIHKLLDGVFFSSMICEHESGKEEIIDARTSDAIALAIRFNAPIFTYKDIMSKAGIILGQESAPKEEEEKDIVAQIEEFLESDMASNDFTAMEDDQLKKHLDEAIANEDYERAAIIRDILNKR